MSAAGGGVRSPVVGLAPAPFPRLVCEPDAVGPGRESGGFRLLSPPSGLAPNVPHGRETTEPNRGRLPTTSSYPRRTPSPRSGHHPTTAEPLWVACLLPGSDSTGPLVNRNINSQVPPESRTFQHSIRWKWVWISARASFQ